MLRRGTTWDHPLSAGPWKDPALGDDVAELDGVHEARRGARAGTVVKPAHLPVALLLPEARQLICLVHEAQALPGSPFRLDGPPQSVAQLVTLARDTLSSCRYFNSFSF